MSGDVVLPPSRAAIIRVGERSMFDLPDSGKALRASVEEWARANIRTADVRWWHDEVAHEWVFEYRAGDA